MLLLSSALLLLAACSDSNPAEPPAGVLSVSLRVSVIGGFDNARALVLGLELDGERILTSDRRATGGCRTCILTTVHSALRSGEHALEIVAVEHQGGVSDGNILGYGWVGTLRVSRIDGTQVQLIELEGAEPVSNGGRFRIATFRSN